MHMDVLIYIQCYMYLYAYQPIHIHLLTVLGEMLQCSTWVLRIQLSSSGLCPSTWVLPLFFFFTKLCFQYYQVKWALLYILCWLNFLMKSCKTCVYFWFQIPCMHNYSSEMETCEWYLKKKMGGNEMTSICRSY